ncbi:MAG: ribonuclease H [Parcubacteria group bacterium Gr01-1014_18]|nr:MAG: ribonuclease H [Parcubacteria group bacterium Greene0416_36]TSC81088.1 MAG: ribonuclease H [Parcubacteria group bacterium Gr01-1014_18]TSC98496.1 MAG: ribonuclease H [Parcubacteria group bacterium Greene1014_20]TSD07339.1 MAG: ribonuclease H [Parcubacteria group bacterium Greene0714_2]
MHIIIYSDGGSRGNPGPAGIGAVLWNADKTKKLAQISKYIGETTNNQAEYRALDAALDRAKELGAKTIECYLDSQLVVRQLEGKYKVKEPGIAAIFPAIKFKLHSFGTHSCHDIRRELNKDADALVNEALDKKLKN